MESNSIMVDVELRPYSIVNPASDDNDDTLSVFKNFAGQWAWMGKKTKIPIQFIVDLMNLNITDYLLQVSPFISMSFYMGADNPLWTDRVHYAVGEKFLYTDYSTAQDGVMSTDMLHRMMASRMQHYPHDSWAVLSRTSAFWKMLVKDVPVVEEPFIQVDYTSTVAYAVIQQYNMAKMVLPPIIAIREWMTYRDIPLAHSIIDHFS